jgi:hypothetical protein
MAVPQDVHLPVAMLIALSFMERVRPDHSCSTPIFAATLTYLFAPPSGLTDSCDFPDSEADEDKAPGVAGSKFPGSELPCPSR